jgi:cell division protein ZapE
MKKENKYREYILKSGIKFDAVQLSAIEQLASWAQDAIYLLDQKPQGVLTKFFAQTKNVQGFYLYGSVGSGKSTICHQLFNSIEANNKSYFHFHEFMQFVHAQLFKLRQNAQLTKESLISELAAKFAKKTRLLYLDEMIVNDIADAMILGPLIQSMIKEGVLIMITSNLHPNELYKNGIQRNSFLRTIDLLNKEFTIVHLKTDQDYRYLNALSLDSFYFITSEIEYIKIFRKLCLTLKIGDFEEKVIDTNGRQILCKETYKNIALFDFAELFTTLNSTADFIALCSTFNIFIISGFRRIQAEEKNEVRRFINFIDTAYDKKVKLFVISSVQLDDIYPKGPLHTEFLRALSRLNEMLK